MTTSRYSKALFERAAAAGLEVVPVSGNPPTLSVGGTKGADPAILAELRAATGMDLDDAARPGLDSRRGLIQMASARGLAERELLTMPVAWSAGLPCPFTVTFRRRSRTCVMTTARAAYRRAEAAGAVVFLAREVEAAALALESGRAGPSDFDGWIEAKDRGAWVLSPELARVAELPGYRPGAEPDVDFADFFHGFGLELVSVDIEPGQAPAGGA